TELAAYPDHAVGHAEDSRLGEVEGRLVGADRAHFERCDTRRHLIAEGEPIDVRASLELVKSRLRDQDGAAESVYEAIGVAIVVAVREQDPLGPPVTLEPVKARVRKHRVQQRPGPRQEV